MRNWFPKFTLWEIVWLVFWATIFIEVGRHIDSDEQGAWVYFTNGILIALVMFKVLRNWWQLGRCLLGSRNIGEASHDRDLSSSDECGSEFSSEYASGVRIDGGQWRFLTLATYVLFQAFLMVVAALPLKYWPLECSIWITAVLYVSLTGNNVARGNKAARGNNWRGKFKYLAFAALLLIAAIQIVYNNAMVVGATEVFTNSMVMGTADMSQDHPFVMQAPQPPFWFSSLGLVAAVSVVGSLVGVWQSSSRRRRWFWGIAWAVGLAIVYGFWYWNQNFGIQSLGPFMVEGLAKLDFQTLNSTRPYDNWVYCVYLAMLAFVAVVVCTNALHSKARVQLEFANKARRRLADFHFVVWLLLTIWMICFWILSYVFQEWLATPYFTYFPTILIPMVLWQLAWRQLPNWKMTLFPRSQWKARPQTVSITVFHPIYYPLTMFALLVSLPAVAYCVQWFLTYWFFVALRNG